jgi:predicted porin
MQKKIIALAVAAMASGAAFAQSNVTVYGVVDAYYGNISNNADVAANVKKFSGVNSGGLSTSRLGFRGTEDLGNGMKALFTLEYQVNTDTGDLVVANARQSSIGLTGNFGTVLAGRLPTAALGWGIKYQPLGGSAVDPLRNVVNATGFVSTLSTADRQSNAVAYVSPNLSGFTVQYNHAFVGETKTEAGNGQRSANILAADYDNGPLSVGVVYRVVGNQSNTGDKTGQKEWSIGGKYAIGTVATLFATYQKGDQNANNGLDYKAYSVGAAVPVTAKGTVVASFANSDVGNTAAGVDQGAKAYTLAYTYALSKRTTAYTAYTSTSNERNTNTVHYGVGGVGVEAGLKTKGFVAGLRHSF